MASKGKDDDKARLSFPSTRCLAYHASSTAATSGEAWISTCAATKPQERGSHSRSGAAASATSVFAASNAQMPRTAATRPRDKASSVSASLVSATRTLPLSARRRPPEPCAWSRDSSVTARRWAAPNRCCLSDWASSGAD
eukprot:149573-Pleurochrysis_carterae.AAC.3